MMDNPFRRGILKLDTNTPNGQHYECVQEFLTCVLQVWNELKNKIY